MKTRAKLMLFVRLVFSISPVYVAMLVLSALVSTGQVLLNVMLPRYLIDELTGLLRPDYLLLYGGLIVGSNLLFALLVNLFKRYFDEKNVAVVERMQLRMADKIMKAPFYYLETPYYLDLKERAMFAVDNQDSLRRLVEVVAKLLQSVITVAALAALLITLSGWLVLVLLGTVGLGLLLFSRVSKKQLAFMQGIIPYNREYGYYVGLCFDDTVQKDIRLYDMEDMVVDSVGHYNGVINSAFLPFYRMNGRYQGAMGVLNDLQGAIAYAYVGLRTFTGALGPRIGLGSFMMYVSAAVSFTKAASDITQQVVTVLQVLGYLDPFAEFMTIPEEKDQGGDVPMDGPVSSIRFENVSFAYPGSDRLVLEDLSFSVEKGEKISVVGLNGSGKTTLVKLLCRLYRPSSGVIYINGRDIFEYDHAQYMRQVAAVFQDFKLFAFSLEENITGLAPGDDPQGAARELEAVGFGEKLQRLPDGLATLLGKAYNEEGTEFSGGEQQKVAIARALYKDASLVILDEPTSALDPLAEAEIYEHFNALIGEKTALYISHRMSSSVFCDRILVLDKGKVCDFAPHAELMSKPQGLYYRLFMSQADNYRAG